jgi:hypothetical protein
MVGVPDKTRTWQPLGENQNRSYLRQQPGHVRPEVCIFYKLSNALFLLLSME